jgi:hypothetical protein
MCLENETNTVDCLSKMQEIVNLLPKWKSVTQIVFTLLTVDIYLYRPLFNAKLWKDM